eukprot:CAMPEP_0117080124 /NCGR_PEP_ID=MMETSP0472-20121206/56535_1 /TAXON_ID=693140 ORGANISM="Tiarina fusus, Strain LIS" /NCGR_SAMPLE_ID=MMETSP0472 /ASSEMBLY_ACC=CAM_ASM_000603 /LENGTH=309 /DNA_ID=CAMNT_0004807641 /DNA_START=16 /DNA_END=944 /DNA_ORIENTATION=+
MAAVASQYFPEFKEGLPSVEGKVFVITGTTSGTGFVAAQTAAEKGGEVVCLNRKSQRVTDATAKLAAAEQVKAKYGSAGGIYCLANNAGIMMTPDKATSDGCDTQMQTNHLSHFILTKELFPLLEAYAEAKGDARVVFHSSGAREMTKKGLEQKYFEKNGGNLGGDGSSMLMGGARVIRYAQTKLANSVMTYAMHEKLKAKGSKVRVIACHPGGSATNLGDGLELPWIENMLMTHIMMRFMQSAEDGTMGLLTGMMVADAESGVLYGPAKSGMSGLAVPNPPKPYETDPEAMKMLWEASEATTGVTFAI